MVPFWFVKQKRMFEMHLESGSVEMEVGALEDEVVMVDEGKEERECGG